MPIDLTRLLSLIGEMPAYHRLLDELKENNDGKAVVLNAARPYLIAGLYLNLQAPVLVVMGTEDPDWPDPEVEANWIVDQLSGELLLVEGAGHYPQTEMPQKVTPGVLDFLERVPAAAEQASNQGP